MVSAIRTTNQIPGTGKITAAASLGTLLEWYDFYLFLNLATIIAARFFPSSHPAAALLFTLASFAAGIVMRPVGALLFGRHGDRSGRKPAFVSTLVIMGLATFAIGLIPGYERIGIAAPLLVLLLRLLQGLAIGGEHGGAITYVAESSPPHRKGYFTSWVQAGAMAGLLISLGVILLTRYALDPDRAISLQKFDVWGWRIPFLAAIILVAIAAWFRRQLQESPGYSPVNTQPIRESFAPGNGKIVLLYIIGLTMGQGIIFTTGGVYAQSFLENVCRIDMDQAGAMVVIALVLSLPSYILAGRWSDRLGRKWLMLAGMLIAIAAWTLLFRTMPAISGTSGRLLLADKTEISNTVSFIDRTKTMLQTSATTNYYQDGMQVIETRTDTVYANGHTSLKPQVSVSRSLPAGDFWKIVVVLFVTALGIAISFGPAAAFLAEAFPPRIRYTSLSFSYQAGIGVFGGLWGMGIVGGLTGIGYPAALTLICLVVGALFLPGGRKGPHLEI